MTELGDDVLERARDGAPGALREIYEALSPKVLGYLRGRGAEDAEGLTSEVFVQVFRRIGRVHGGVAGLRTFVFSVAHARLVDELRSRSRRPVTVPYDAAEDQRSSRSAEAEALDNDAPRRVYEMLDELNPDQRAVLVLRVVADLSIDETATALGKTPGAVKQLQRRGLLTLRAAMNGSAVDRRD
jgi:RNA polymerase sigma-70 factor (ECF subfamily)